LQDKSNSPQRPHRAVADLFALFVTEGARKADAAVSRELSPDSSSGSRRSRPTRTRA